MSDAVGRARQIVANHLGVDPYIITNKSIFVDDLGADSLDTVELVMAFEEEFGIEIPDDAVEACQTFGDLVLFLEGNGIPTIVGEASDSHLIPASPDGEKTLMKIALIGDRDSGKTSFLGALHAVCRVSQASRQISKAEEMERCRNIGIRLQAGFVIEGYAYEQDQKLFAGIAEGMTDSPMRWPGITALTDFFPIDVRFECSEIGDTGTLQRYKRLALVDVPGGHFSLAADHDEKALDSRKTVSNCEAIILFIDVSDLADTMKRVELIEKNVRDILRGASKALENTNQYLPVSIVLSKMDVHAPEKRSEIHDEIFNEIVTSLSFVGSKLLFMSCPMMITSRRINQFAPKQIEYPFLFSALGIIAGQYYGIEIAARNAQQEADSSVLKQISHWFNGTQAQLNQEATLDAMLAVAIVQGMKADLLLERCDLRFAQAGAEIDLSQLEKIL